MLLHLSCLHCKHSSKYEVGTFRKILSCQEIKKTAKEKLDE